METLLYRPEAAAAVLGIGRSKLYELIALGHIRTVKIGRSTRVPSMALEDFVNALSKGDVKV